VPERIPSRLPERAKRKGRDPLRLVWTFYPQSGPRRALPHSRLLHGADPPPPPPRRFKATTAPIPRYPHEDEPGLMIQPLPRNGSARGPDAKVSPVFFPGRSGRPSDGGPWKSTAPEVSISFLTSPIGGIHEEIPFHPPGRSRAHSRHAL